VNRHPGDQGSSLLGNKKNFKDSSLLEAIGALDELNAWLGWARAMVDNKIFDLIRIQKDLGKIMAELACFGGEKLSADDLRFLEQITTQCEKKAKPLTEFIIPGDNRNEAIVNIARTVCRRAERRVVALSRRKKVSPFVLAYLNRLSTLLFCWLVILRQ